MSNDSLIADSKSKEAFDWGPIKFVSSANIKDKPTQASPSPIRVIWWSEHEKLLKAAQSRHRHGLPIKHNGRTKHNRRSHCPSR
jgi:hypothetical protein